MKVICIVCELWLVEPVVRDGEVSYFCLRCQDSGRCEPLSEAL
jgi:hypothetical protein